MRVVLDANVLVSAVLQTGPSYRIVGRWLDVGDLEVVICSALLAEVEDVLNRPRIRKRVAPGLADQYLATVRRIADMVADPSSVGAETRDPDDDYLIALAREHAVDFIVTGDKDLLEWEAQQPPAIGPAAFDQLLG